MTGPASISYTISFPVLAARRHDSSASYVLQGEIRGTCFAIGDDLFLTAAHVIADLKDSTDLLLVIGLYDPQGRFIGAEVVASELLPHDVAVLRVKHLTPQTITHFQRFQWSTSTLPLLTDVHTLGYAYGMQPTGTGKTIMHRAFKGYLVSTPRQYLKPSGESPFPAYETSFPAPRGLSGSPLFFGFTPSVICGMVLGNSESKMLVFDSEDVSTSGDTIERVERYESLALGVAIRSEFIMSLPSELLSGTVGGHLARAKLLADPA